MKRMPNASRLQLTLLLEREATNPLVASEKAHEALITTLGALLLEALGVEVKGSANEQGGRDEPEDYI